MGSTFYYLAFVLLVATFSAAVIGEVTIQDADQNGPVLTPENFDRASSLIGMKPPARDKALMRQPTTTPNEDRNQLGNAADTWPGGIVPYRIAANTYSEADLDIIAAGILDLTSNTCIQMVQDVDSKARDYVMIESEADGCFYQGGGFNEGTGKHTINIMKGAPGMGTCVWPSIVTHEINHALGCMHEQRRADRDEFITIHWDNINGGGGPQYWRDEWVYDTEANGARCQYTGVDGTDYSDCVSGGKTENFGFGYDYLSIMHYGKYDFAIDSNKPTITWNANPDEDFGSDQLSVLDIEKIKSAYSCPGQSGTSCYKHLNAASGSFNSNDVAKGCQILLSSPTGLVKIRTKIWDVTSDCSTSYIDIYKGSNLNAPSAKVGTFCSSDTPGAFTLGSDGTILVQTDSSQDYWEMEYSTDQEADLSPAVNCCPGPLDVSADALGSWAEGFYTLTDQTVENDGRIYPVYERLSIGAYLYRIPDPTPTSYYVSPWCLGPTVPEPSGWGFYGETPQCPEYLVRDSAGGNVNFECMFECSGDPAPATPDATRNWDGSRLFNHYAQYVCPGGVGFQYAVCDVDGWVYYDMGMETDCYEG